MTFFSQQIHFIAIFSHAFWNFASYAAHYYLFAQNRIYASRFNPYGCTNCLVHQSFFWQQQCFFIFPPTLDNFHKTGPLKNYVRNLRSPFIAWLWCLGQLPYCFSYWNSFKKLMKSWSLKLFMWKFQLIRIFEDYQKQRCVASSQMLP